MTSNQASTKDATASPLERLFHVFIRPTGVTSDESSSEDEMYVRPRAHSTGATGTTRGLFTGKGSLRRRRRRSTLGKGTKRAPAGLVAPLDEGGIGHSPSYRQRPHGDSFSSRATSRRSSHSSSLLASARSHVRGQSGDTPATSISSCAPVRGRQPGPAHPPQPKPVAIDLYPSQPPKLRDPWREDQLLKATGGSYVASLGLRPLPVPSPSARQSEPPVIHISTDRPLPPTLLSPLSQEDLTTRSPRTPAAETLSRRRSRSLSDMHYAAQSRTTALASGLRSAEGSRPRRAPPRGPVIFEPADATCATWIAPRPRLIGRFDWEANEGRKRPQMSSVEKRAAARRAQARASKLRESFDIDHDPRMRSQPLGWTASNGFAGPSKGSPPLASSFGWLRSPVRRPVREMATQTPGDMRWERKRSMSSVTRREKTVLPRRRSSSLSNLVTYDERAQAERASSLGPRPRSTRSRHSTEAQRLATPLPTLYSGYMFDGDFLERRPSDAMRDGPSSSAPPTTRRRVSPPERHLPPSLTVAPLRRPSSARPSTGDAAVQVDMRDSRSSGPLLTPTLGFRPDETIEEPVRPGSAPPSTSARTSFSLDSEQTDDVSENGDFPNLFFSPPLASLGMIHRAVTVEEGYFPRDESVHTYDDTIRRPSDERSSMLDLDSEDESEDEEPTARQRTYSTAEPSPAISTVSLPPHTTVPLNLPDALRAFARSPTPTASASGERSWDATSFAESLFDGSRLQRVRDSPVTVVQPREMPSQASMRAETVYDSAVSRTPERSGGSLSAASSFLDFQQSPSVSPIAPFFLRPREREVEDEDAQEYMQRDSWLNTDDSPERERGQYAQGRASSFLDESDSDIGTPLPYSRMRFSVDPAAPVPPTSVDALSVPTGATSSHLSTDSAGQERTLSTRLSGASGGLAVSTGRDSLSNYSVGSSLHDRLSSFPAPPSPTDVRQSLGATEVPQRPRLETRRSRSLPMLPSLATLSTQYTYATTTAESADGERSLRAGVSRDFLDFDSPERSIDRTGHHPSTSPPGRALSSDADLLAFLEERTPEPTRVRRADQGHARTWSDPAVLAASRHGGAETPEERASP